MKEWNDDVFLSEYLMKRDELDKIGVFDCVLNKDSHFFINLLRLKNSSTPEFKDSYNKINRFFEEIMVLLSNATKKSCKDKLYKTALNRFNFREVNEINLGFSESNSGSGFGQVLKEKVISDAYDIVKTGSQHPEIFQLVGLFEENVGADRLSDMIATLVLDDITRYTRRINRDIQINKRYYPKYEFIDGILINPFKNCRILYLPKDILHELPIARGWDDIDRVISENRAIRNEINESISQKWTQLSTSNKKEYIKTSIFMNQERCSRVIEAYRGESIGIFNPKYDFDYYSSCIFKEIKSSGVLSFVRHGNDKIKSSKEISLLVLYVFKDWVENNAGWRNIQEARSNQREKVVQKLIHLCGKYICKEHDYDFTFEPNEGPGPADIKISRGAYDKTIIEVKLNTNSNYLHGYKTQIEEYAKAEGTTKSIFVYVEIEAHEGRTKKIKELSEVAKQKDINAPDLLIVDARRRNSASKS